MAYPRREGFDDVGMSLQRESLQKRTGMARLLSRLRFRPGPKDLSEQSSFFSHTKRSGPAFSSYSQMGSMRPVSPQTTQGISFGDMRINSTRRTGSSPCLKTPTVEDVHEEEEDADASTSILQPLPTLTVPLSSTTNTRNFRDQGSSRSPLSEVVEASLDLNAEGARLVSVNSDDFIVSFGTTDIGRIVPPIRNHSSDEEPNPAEYGNRRASLYENLGGMFLFSFSYKTLFSGKRESVSDFSFMVPKSSDQFDAHPL